MAPRGSLPLLWQVGHPDTAPSLDCKHEKTESESSRWKSVSDTERSQQSSLLQNVRIAVKNKGRVTTLVHKWPPWVTIQLQEVNSKNPLL